MTVALTATCCPGQLQSQSHGWDNIPCPCSCLLLGPALILELAPVASSCKGRGQHPSSNLGARVQQLPTTGVGDNVPVPTPRSEQGLGSRQLPGVEAWGERQLAQGATGPPTL